MAEIAKIVQGNNFNVAIPLKVYILNEGEVVLEDYTPAEGDDVTIRLVGERRGYTYKPTIEGNVAHLQLSGHEVCNTYAVEVVIIGTDGTILRSYRGDQLAIVYNVDTIIADGAVEDGELYLDSQFFVQGQKGEQGDPGQDGTDGQDGADGRGIVSITKTATQGLVDTYTITYTDGTTSTFEVTNGKDGSGGGGEDFIVNVTYSGGAYTADKTPQECCMAFLDGKRVVFVNTASTPLYGDSRTFIATSVSVYNQYNQWNIYAVSGNGRGDAKVDILCYERQYTTSLTFKSIAAQVQSDWSQADNTKADFIKNKPTIPAAQVNADWDAASGVAQILNKPTIPTKTSDLSNDSNFASIPYVHLDGQKHTNYTYDTLTGNGNGIPLTDGQLMLVRISGAATATGYTLYINIDQAHNYPATSNKTMAALTYNGMPTVRCGDFPVYTQLLLRFYNGMWYVVASGTLPTNLAAYATTAAMNTALSGKQDVTAIETMPSGAIAPTAGYEPNKMYDFGKVASVTFATYDTSKEIANAVNLYMCTFVVASGGTTLTLNANIKYPNGDDGTELTNLLTEEDRVFEITIRDNKLSYLYFD